MPLGSCPRVSTRSGWLGLVGERTAVKPCLPALGAPRVIKATAAYLHGMNATSPKFKAASALSALARQESRSTAAVGEHPGRVNIGSRFGGSLSRARSLTIGQNHTAVCISPTHPLVQACFPDGSRYDRMGAGECGLSMCLTAKRPSINAYAFDASLMDSPSSRRLMAQAALAKGWPGH